MLLLSALRGNLTHGGQNNFVTNRSKACRRECPYNRTTAQPLTKPPRVQSFAGLVHKQRFHRPRVELRASSDQIDQSTPRVELASLRPEVLQVLPEKVDLDLKLHGGMLEQGVLDTSILSSVNNPLGSLWLSTEQHIDQYLAEAPARTYEPSLVKKPENKLALRLSMFLTLVTQKYFNDSKPAHLDRYVLASSAVKAYDAIGKFGDNAKRVWTERSIHLLQLATQLLNHPGTSREGGLSMLPPGLPQQSTGAFSAFNGYSVGDNLAALKCASASVDINVRKTNCPPMYLHLKMFISLQCSAGWYPEHGKGNAQAGDVRFLLGDALCHMSRLSAISSIPKLGGYSFVQLSRLLQLCQDIQGCQEFVAPVFRAEITRHEAWCSKLQPVLNRSMEFSIPEHAWEALRKARRFLLPGLVDDGKFKGRKDAWEFDMRELNELRRAKPNFFQVPASAMPPLKQAFASGWFDAMFPEGTFDSDQYFDHEVLAHLTLHCMERGQYTRAAKLLTSGLSAGVHDSYQYIHAYKQFLVHATRQLFGSQEVSSTEDKISLACLQEVFVLWAWVLRTAAGCVDSRSFLQELCSFAHQTVTFARQHGQYSLLWRVLNTMLCAWQLPAAPNLAAPFIMAINVSFSKHRRFREQMLHYMAKNNCIQGPDAWKAAMSGFNFDGSHPEVMAACKLARLAEDRILLGQVLKNKTGPQFLAGSERFLSPQALEQLSDSFWDLQGKSIARRPFPDLQQELKMVRLSASTCTKLLQALGRLHGSLSPADLGPADSMTAAQRQAAQTQASTMLAGGAWYVYEYCMDAGHKVAPADADVVWDLQASPGCEEMLLGFFDAWLVGKALSHLGMSVSTNMPRWPSSSALQHLLDDQLLQQAWEKAASVALHHTVHCPEPALQGLKVALEGVRKGHCSDRSQELPTVCQGQYADGRPCTASAKKHGYCLRHQKQASTPPSVKPVLSRLYEQGNMHKLSQQLAVAKAIDYTDVTEVAFVLELHAQVASTNPALMLTVVENVCGRGDMKLAFKLLQENIQLAEQNRHVYSTLLGRLRPWHGVMKLVRGALTASAAGNAVMSGLMGACSTATDSDAAWALYQDACSYGYMLDDHAQQVLWDLQSDERLLQLHAHFRSGVGPLVSAPSTHTLAEIAALYIAHANWEAAMAIATELPGQKEAAEIVSGVVQGVERSNGSLMTVALPGIHVLHETQRHADIVKVFSAVQAQDPSCIAPEHLHMALLAWLQQKDLIAATTSLSRHHALAVNWTAPQQQAVFQKALNCFEAAQNDAALPLLQSMCMAGLQARLPHAPMQAHELVMAMLCSGQTQNAFQVSTAVHLQQGVQLQLNTVALVLDQSLQRDMHKADDLQGMSALTHDLLDLWKHCAGVKWAQALGAPAAASVAKLLIRAQEWQQATEVFEAQASQQVVTEALWDAAATAYFHLGDMAGMQAAWSWAQTHPGAHSWVPSSPDCCMYLATALTQLYAPMQGVALLAAYNKQGYNPLLSVVDCNNFIHLCLQQLKAESEHGDYYEAVLTLLQHMISSSGMPQPDVATFTCALECLLASSSGRVPDHQLLAQLQQDIWQPMHQVLSSDSSSSAAYLPAFIHFAESGASEVFLLILLMAQNGLPGLEVECCFALAVVMEDHQEEWLCEHVGTKFIEQVYAAADERSAKSTQVVMFPAHELPKLMIAQLRNGSSCLVLQDTEMPWWMLPVGEQLQLQAVPQAKVTSNKQSEASAVTNKETAAEKLVREYGHLGRGSGRKGRR